jgi:hypothetical protein
VPKLAASVDKATISTELLSTNQVTVTLQGSGGFAGSVALAGSVVDAAGTAIPGWTVSLDSATVAVAADGTATAVATVKVPSQSTALTGTVKIDVTPPGLAPSSVVSAVTVANQLSVPMAVGNGTTCGASASPALTISQGTKVVWKNADPAKRITIHINAGVAGFTHEPDPGMAPAGTAGDTYVQTAAGAGTVTWYCHAPGTDANRYKIVVQ